MLSVFSILGCWITVILLLDRLALAGVKLSASSILAAMSCSSRDSSAAKTETPDYRAEKLLLSWLSPEQKCDFVARRKFVVIGSDMLLYEISELRSYNVKSVSTGAVMCLVFDPGPAYTLYPIADLMLAQKILLETDAPSFRCMAHRPANAGWFDDNALAMTPDYERN